MFSSKRRSNGLGATDAQSVSAVPNRSFSKRNCTGELDRGHGKLRRRLRYAQQITFLIRTELSLILIPKPQDHLAFQTPAFRSAGRGVVLAVLLNSFAWGLFGNARFEK